jgi:nucleoside-diphosphate-sugar epimerase
MSSKLKGRKVLVTGGAGFIGSHIVDKLVNLEAKVVVLDNLCAGNIDNLKHNLDKIKFIEKDLTDDSALEEALEGVELISHQAALRSVPKSVDNPLDYHKVNVTGSLKLFLKAQEKGVRRIVFASSSSVYGERTDFPEKETDLPCPISPYAATKLMVEHYASVFKAQYGLEVISLRYFNVFGPRQSLESQYAVVVPKFINCLFKQEAPPIYGEGNQMRDFTYISDVVEANILGLVRENIAGETFNIASGKAQSVNNLLEMLQNITSKNIAPVYLDKRPGDVEKTHADIEKAKKLLGWEPKVDFYEGLKKAVEHFKK